MQTRYAASLAILVGVTAAGLIVNRPHAQSTPPAYAVLEIDVQNQDAYAKEFLPNAAKAISSAGGKYIARGGQVTAIEGGPPKRSTIIQFENAAKAKAAFDSAAYREARKAGDKYATYRIYIVEGTPSQ